MLINIKNNSNKNKNLGLQLLRMILSFFIVLYHCCNVKNKILCILLFKKPFHVSSFFLISFYFYYNVILARNIYKIKLRFLRILIPYIIWPLIFYIFNNSFYSCFGLSLYKNKLSFKDLIIQIILGRNYHQVFWFQFNLMFITFLFTIISFVLKDNFLTILQIIGIIAYYLQYSSLNYYCFISYNYQIRHTLGQIVEMLPIGVTGLFLASINIIKKIEKNRNKSILLIIMLFLLILNVEIFIRPKGFLYPGILLNIGAILLFCCFGILFIHISNSYLVLFISNITNYTGGVYYLHTVIRNIIINISLIKNREYSGSIIIYIICYLICLSGNKILGKTKLKYLFN